MLVLFLPLLTPVHMHISLSFGSVDVLCVTGFMWHYNGIEIILLIRILWLFLRGQKIEIIVCFHSLGDTIYYRGFWEPLENLVRFILACH